MGKTHISKDLEKRRISRPLLAVSLAASLAAFGCTTNHNLGNGTPTRSGPELHTAPSSGIGGSETVTPPPMTSSYTRAEVLPAVTPRSIHHSADEAAAIMAGRQAVRGRYLGQVNPGPGNRPYASDYASTYVNPALQTNPQLTVNSSISSPPTGAINSGAGGVATDAGGVLVTGGTTGTTAAATVAGTATTTTGATTAGTAAALPAGTFAAAAPTATQAIANNPAVTAASLGAGRTAVGVTTGTTIGTTGTTTTAATTTAASTAAATTNVGATGGVRILRGSSGVTITNTNTATTTATGSSTRSQ
jgi:hypothetical protein